METRTGCRLLARALSLSAAVLSARAHAEPPVPVDDATARGFLGFLGKMALLAGAYLGVGLLIGAAIVAAAVSLNLFFTRHWKRTTPSPAGFLRWVPGLVSGIVLGTAYAVYYFSGCGSH